MTVTQQLNAIEKRIRELEKKRNIATPSETRRTKKSPKRKSTGKKKATKKDFSMRAYGWSSKEERVKVRRSAIDRAIREHGFEEVQKFFVKMSRMHNKKPSGVVFKADLVYIDKK